VNLRVISALGVAGALIFVLWVGLGELYDTHYVDPSRRPALFLLLGIIVAFVMIRFNTRMIRAGVTWWPGNIEHGDIHVHHALIGLLGMLVAGILEFVFAPPHPGVDLLALVFGMGVGLALDEFALFLHIEDVYWEEDGRKSIDAVIMSIVVMAMFAVGAVPLGLDEGPRLAAGQRWLLIALVTGNAILVIVTLLKGRLWLGVLGLLVPFITWWGALRLAKPSSPWARRWYRKRPDLVNKARRRDLAFHAKWGRRKHRLYDLIGGRPHPRSR
jgi:lysyl-tRNA synthetase class 2